MNRAVLKFSNEFAGVLNGKNGSIAIGKGDQYLMPYEMLIGALGSCLYSTFLDVTHKMRLDFETCELDITWEKRTEVPMTLKVADIKVSIVGADSSKHHKYEQAFKLATEYCSIFVTLSHVANITYSIAFDA